MENKQYEIPLEGGTEKVPAFQNEMSIKQSKQLRELFVKNEIDKDFDFLTTPAILTSTLIEKNIHKDFLQIILINGESKQFNLPIDADKIPMNTVFNVVEDFFTINPGLVMLFGSSATQAATTKLRTSLSSTVTGLSNPLPNSSDSISEEKKSENGGTVLPNQSVN